MVRLKALVVVGDGVEDYGDLRACVTVEAKPLEVNGGCQRDN